MNASHCRGWLLAGLLTVSAVACAQTAAAPPAEGKDSKEAREAAEAMERARRLAANPLRMIQEASRVRRRGEADAPAVGAAPEPAARPAPAAAAAAEPAPLVMSSDLAQVRVGPATTPPLAAQVLPAALEPAAALPSLAPLRPGVVRPTIVSRVDPEIPARVLVDLEPNTVVTADLNIRADGSVADVTIVSSSARTLARFIVPALMQWRFEPLPSDRQWRVELLFRGD